MPDTQTPKDAVEYWKKELTAAKERETGFRKDGQRILELYDGTHAENTPFNILYSNTETLHPALYSTIPRPVVQRRLKDEDPIGKASAQAGQRVLEFLLDTNVDGYETFDDGVSAATLTALLPGRAVTAVKYDAKGPDDAPTSELVCLDSKQWNRILFGYAKTWSKVPWIAYEEFIDEAEAVRLFTKDVAAKLTFTDQEQKEASDETKGTKEEPNQGERKVCRIWQIWDKDGGRKVRYFSEQYGDGMVKEEDDPLELAGFFNCPKPLQFLKKPHSTLPTAIYILYESQANELNELTRRIKMIAKAIKARGLYDGSISKDLKTLMTADDNELVPIDSASSLATEKGMDHAIWFMPVDKLIVVLRELMGVREACKQVIYEITGISDILRGATKASETLGAQEIKTQWGTLRLKRAQKEVARYARDLLRLMLEMAATKFSEETWAAMTGLPFLLSTKFNELTAIAQALTTEVQQIQASQPPLPPGQPPMPPPQVQQLQQIQQQLQAPQWSKVLELLKTDLYRSYRIDIETNSTVEPEAVEDQKNIQEVMAAMGQVLNGIGPLVAKGVLPFEAAQVMLLTIVRRYRYGTELEDTIKAMKPPPPEDDGKAAEMAKMQQQAAQQQMESQKQAAAQDLQVKTMTAEKGILEQKVDLQLREAALKDAEKQFALAQQAFEKERAMSEQVQQATMALEKSKWQADRATKAMELKIQQETDIKTALIDKEAKIAVAEIAAKAQKDKPQPVGAA